MITYASCLLRLIGSLNSAQPRRRGPIPRRGFMDDLEWTLGFGFRPELFNIIPEPSRPVEPLFEDPMQDLRATIEHIRASLPQAAFRDQSFMSDEDEGYGMEAEEVQALVGAFLFIGCASCSDRLVGGPALCHAAPRYRNAEGRRPRCACWYISQ